MNNIDEKKIKDFLGYSYARKPVKPIKESIVRTGHYIAVIIMSIFACATFMLTRLSVTDENNIYIFMLPLGIIILLSVVLIIRGERKAQNKEAETLFLGSQMWSMFALWLIAVIASIYFLPIRSGEMVYFIITIALVVIVCSFCSAIFIKHRISSNYYNGVEAPKETIYTNPGKYGFIIAAPLIIALGTTKNIILCIYIIMIPLSAVMAQYNTLCLMQLIYAKKYHFEKYLPKFQYY